MKKLAVFLTVLVILSHISTCSFAYEATVSENFANNFASQFLNKIASNIYYSTEYDLSIDTIACFEDSPQIKNEIIEKAKEYEDEIRNNHFYRYREDDGFISETAETDAHGAIQPPEADALKKRQSAKQFDNMAIEDVLSSFPIFIEKKVSYKKVVAHAYDMSPPYFELFTNSPYSVTVSESGFAYVNYGDCYVLLYRYEVPDDDRWQWVVCDVSTFYDEYDEKYRFHSEDMDVEKELISEGYKLTSENEDTNTDTDNETNTDTATDTDSTDKSYIEAQDSPNESEPTGYIPWVICGIEAVAIIALALAFVLKKKK